MPSRSRPRGQAALPLRFLLVLLPAWLLGGCSTLQQPLDLTSPVKQRTAQARIELEDGPAQAYARWAVPFARVASVVRCNDLKASDPEQASGEGCDNLLPLEQTGWALLYASTDLLDADEEQSGLRFAAYARQLPGETRGEILIGFRGTRPTHGSDWRANLRWITQYLPLPGRDHYQVVHRHAGQMVTLALQRALDRFPAAQAFDVYTTGHSLGGGLAQLLAYSDQRVIGAVVFDPSPVTGYNNVVKDPEANCSARVARIYERGEGLAYIRTALRYFYALSPNIEEVSFDFIHTGGNPFANHSMTDLRRGLEGRAGVQAGLVVSTNSSGLSDQPDCDCYRLRRPTVRRGSRQFAEATGVCAVEVPVVDASDAGAGPAP